MLPGILLISVVLTAVVWGVTRYTRTRTKLSLVAAVGVAALLTVGIGYLIVTMSTRFEEPNSIFFAQLALVPAFIFALAAVWQFLKAVSWFDGTVEKPLRAEESGARSIETPLIAEDRRPAAIGPEIADMSTRIVAYLIDAVIVGVITVVPYLIGNAAGLGVNALIAAAIVGSIASTVYFPVFWHLRGHRPSMRVRKIRVIH